MDAFIVDLKNKPAELAKVAEAIAEKGIDITGFSGSTFGDSGTLTLTTDNEVATRRVLTDGGWKFRTIEVVETSLPNKPGSLPRRPAGSAKAGINIEAAFPAGMTGTSAHLVFATDNPAKAKQALGEPVGATSR